MSVRKNQQRIAYGAAIRAQRKQRDMPLKELAAKIGVSASTLCMAEKSLNATSMYIIERAAKAFGMNTSDLVRYAEINFDK